MLNYVVYGWITSEAFEFVIFYVIIDQNGQKLAERNVMGKVDLDSIADGRGRILSGNYDEVKE